MITSLEHPSILAGRQTIGNRLKDLKGIPGLDLDSLVDGRNGDVRDTVADLLKLPEEQIDDATEGIPKEQISKIQIAVEGCLYLAQSED